MYAKLVRGVKGWLEDERRGRRGGMGLVNTSDYPTTGTAPGISTPNACIATRFAISTCAKPKMIYPSNYTFPAESHINPVIRLEQLQAH